MDSARLVVCKRDKCQAGFVQGKRWKKYCSASCRKSHAKEMMHMFYRQLRALNIKSSVASKAAKTGRACVENLIKKTDPDYKAKEEKCKRDSCGKMFTPVNWRQKYCCAYCMEISIKIARSLKKKIRYKQLKDLGLHPSVAAAACGSQIKTDILLKEHSRVSSAEHEGNP